MTEILLVDDDAAFRSMLARQLARAGYEVREAGDGRVALELYRARPSDLVVLDVIMPWVEGTETLMALRKLAPAVKIVAISGGGLTDPRLNLSVARKLGAQGTLCKPFKLDELLEVIGAVLAAP